MKEDKHHPISTGHTCNKATNKSQLIILYATEFGKKPVARIQCALPLDPLKRGRSILDVHLD